MKCAAGEPKPNRETRWMLDLLEGLVKDSSEPIDTHRTSRELLVGHEAARRLMRLLANQGRCGIQRSGRLYIYEKDKPTAKAKRSDPRQDGKRYLHDEVADLLRFRPMRPFQILEALPHTTRPSVASALHRLKKRGVVRPIGRHFYELVEA